MQLGEAVVRGGMKETGERILALRDELAAVHRELAAAGKEHEDACDQAEADFRRESGRLEEAEEDIPVADPGPGDRAALERRRDARIAKVKRAETNLVRRLEGELERRRREASAEIERIQERLAAEDEDRRGPLEERFRRWEELGPVIRDRYSETANVVREFAVLHAVRLENPPEWSGEVDPDADPNAAAAGVTKAFEDVLLGVRREGSRRGFGLSRPGLVILALVVLVATGGAAAALALGLGAGPVALAVVGGAVVLGAAVVLLVGRSARARAGLAVRTFAATAAAEAGRFARHQEAALKHLDRRCVECAEEHRAAVEAAEAAVREKTREESAPAVAALEQAKERANRLEWRVLARHGDRLAELKARADAARRGREETRAAAFAALEEEHRERRAEIDGLLARRRGELEARRRAALDGFAAFAAAASAAVREDNPPWSEVEPRRIELPKRFPATVPFSGLEVAPAALVPGTNGANGANGADADAGPFRLPAVLDFPAAGSLLVRHAGPGREEALELLTNAVLRVLTSFPAGKARLTLVDPVGLGQSFSALMHLADHDEALVNGRIWTETPHIERRLAMLTEHIEKVIQKYLRNRYDTIGEYNEEAGELQEPYHFLVIADFPASFNDVAAERLMSILSSGPRCGVYTFVSQDTRLSLPPIVDPAILARNGPVLDRDRERLRLSGPGLERAAFRPERPPEPEVASALLDTIGRQSVDADRVEVPFAAVTPGDDDVWSGSTTRGVRVPIGRTGAERLQIFDLGKGTAQHALVAGRTGSGKSTLFHVLITNLSLWFSPDEIEFYLIDFKKGVEFKPFATHRLPHARVVAIESDREFGLSVLRAIDVELSRRGDLFRRLGVQDLAGYRRHPEATTLPRSLVVIDEFQEFFTEDDAVARDAALLLDRFVRQGRAFGIHMVLGSQTLSGIYTLAKSTLGQMGVRIALQCNESDSYLVLSEDNGVARLLTRPGEAIYNDMSGLLEGNNPFQVVWLPEEEEAGHLARVAARAAASGRPVREAVVFEGNTPARLEKNAELAALVAAGPPEKAEGDDRIWLGEPNAIKGPTEVRFLPASGSNLLVVGQRRDAAFAMMAAAVRSLAAQRPVGDLRVVILDGGGHEPEYAEHFARLIDSVPHRIERYDLRAVPDAVEEIAAIVDRRGEGHGEEDHSPVYVFAFGLQRLRALRREDEFSMSFSAEEKASTGDRFATILTDGPARSVHTIVWCDTLVNLNRTLSRQAMKEFDVRVLFQMSAADSSELIDSSAANQLGLYNALLAVESTGTFEKFRPYALPRPAAARTAG